ncbi:PAS domain S-box protein [Paraburkholderia sp. RL18-085-BIA-A]|uniref:PAS domain S-box protein n=1 Tax=Paraburkholderia sp. RL18-085-BIA-A TaxID=3031633 RepID=UPI0038B6EE03
MKNSQLPWNEAARLEALRNLGILDTPTEADFDDVVALTASICEVPICAINLIEDQRQWFKAEIGLGVREMPLDVSICASALLQPDLLVVPDLTQDDRFCANPLVAGEPKLRFYAGAVLRTRSGLPIGTLCVLDYVVRDLSPLQRHTLATMARQVMAQIELRKAAADAMASAGELRRATEKSRRLEAHQRTILDSAVDYAIIGTDLRGRVTSWNHGAQLILGYNKAEATGQNLAVIYTPEDVQQGAPDTEMRKAMEQGRGSDERWHVRKDGTRFLASGEMMPLLGDGTIPAGFIKIFRDVTVSRANERRLRDSEDRLRFAFEAAGNVGTWEWKSATDKVITDEKLAEMHGLSAGEATQGISLSRYFEPIHEDDRNRVEASFVASIRSGQDFAEEYRLTTAEGQRWLFARGRAYFDKQGSETRFPGVAVDVTERHRAERALLESQAYLKLLLDSTMEGFYALDCDGVTTMCNATFVRMLGFGSETEAIGKKLHVVIHHSHPDGAHYDVADCPIFTCARFGTPAHVEDEYFFSLDGKRIPVEYRVVPIISSGVHRGAICTFTDISARRRVEDALRLLNETLEVQIAARTQERDRIWSQSGDLLAVGNLATGRWLSANPAWTKVLGWHPAEVAGAEVTRFEASDEVGSTIAGARLIEAGTLAGHFENRYRTKDGATKWISWTSSVSGAEFYVAGRDITAERESLEALRSVEETLRQAQKMDAVGQLTGGIAHDFNNLLQGITVPLELIKRRVALNQLDGLDRFIGMAMTSAQRAAALTHRLLAFSRRQPLAPENIDVNERIRSLEDLLRRTTGEHIEVNFALELVECRSTCDANQLENALLNLCINAKDAMPDGGMLTIETSCVQVDSLDAHKRRDMKPGHYIAVTVTDTGEGMPPDVVKQAFEPFFTTKPIGQGTGLGLSMVYGFAGQSGGFVTIVSRVGAGTTVTLYLPESGAIETNEIAAARAEPNFETGTGQHILVVEDGSTVRQLLADMLTQSGYNVHQAVDGSSGLAALDSMTRVDLLVTDVGLPGMNGRQMADAARAKRPALPVLFMTGYAEVATVASGFLGERMQMIAKPFSVEAIGAKIRQMLEKDGERGS